MIRIALVVLEEVLPVGAPRLDREAARAPAQLVDGPPRPRAVERRREVRVLRARRRELRGEVAGKLGLAQLTISGREWLVAVAPMQDGLVMEMLRYADELRDPAEYFDEVPTLKPGYYLLNREGSAEAGVPRYVYIGENAPQGRPELN